MITGTVNGITGLVTGVAADPTYLDVLISSHVSFTYPIERGQPSSPMCLGVRLDFNKPTGSEWLISHPHLLVFGDGDSVTVKTEAHSVRLLLVSGKPLGDPSLGMVLLS